MLQKETKDLLTIDHLCSFSKLNKFCAEDTTQRSLIDKDTEKKKLK